MNVSPGVFRKGNQLLAVEILSVVHDHWGDSKLSERLFDDENMYRLRRSGNNWKP